MGHIERKLREKEEIKQRILVAAREIATKEGWHSVTIRKIAEKIEYTPPVVYEHFENKEDLIREIIYSGFMKMHEDFTELRKNETDPKKLIRVLSISHWDFAFNNIELYRLMFSLERPPHTDEVTSNLNAIEAIFLSISKDEEEMHELILQWMCMTNGAISIVMKLSCFPHMEKQNPREIFIKMIDRFIERLLR